MCAMFDVSVTQPHAADADTGADADVDAAGDAAVVFAAVVDLADACLHAYTYA